MESNAGEIDDERVVASIGEDSAITRISDSQAIVTSTDFFTPIIDDPYIQGQIAACNATNDVYAKGALDVLSVLAIMGMPEDLPLKVQKEVLQGFCDFCRSLDAPVVGGHTIVCPWPIMGGAVTALANLDNLVFISKAKPGDKIVLTKPLGVQPVMRLLRIPDIQQEKMAEIIPEEELSKAIDTAIHVMTTSNKKVAQVMIEVGVNAATDVTGFGIFGHASNMAEQSGVSILIDMLPVIKGTPKIAKTFGYPLLQGKASETAGGQLISVPRERVNHLLSALRKEDCEGYIVGEVRKGQGKAFLTDDVDVVEI